MRIDGVPNFQQFNFTQNLSQKTPATDSFADQLQNTIKEVNEIQKTADKLTTDFALGKIENLHDVTIATEKAHIAMDTVLAVHRKVLDTYKELMRLQI